MNKKPLYLNLYHGRKEPAQRLKDWGSDGPAIKIADFGFTYTTLWFVPWNDGKPTDRVELDDFIHEGMVHYDGVYYGDFCVDRHAYEGYPVEDWDTAKAVLPASAT